MPSMEPFTHINNSETAVSQDKFSFAQDRRELATKLPSRSCGFLLLCLFFFAAAAAAQTAQI